MHGGCESAGRCGRYACGVGGQVGRHLLQRELQEVRQHKVGHAPQPRHCLHSRLILHDVITWTGTHGLT